MLRTRVPNNHSLSAQAPAKKDQFLIFAAPKKADARLEKALNNRCGLSNGIEVQQYHRLKSDAFPNSQLATHSFFDDMRSGTAQLNQHFLSSDETENSIEEILTRNTQSLLPNEKAYIASTKKGLLGLLLTQALNLKETGVNALQAYMDDVLHVSNNNTTKQKLTKQNLLCTYNITVEADEYGLEQITLFFNGVWEENGMALATASFAITFEPFIFEDGYIRLVPVETRNDIQAKYGDADTKTCIQKGKNALSFNSFFIIKCIVQFIRSFLGYYVCAIDYSTQPHLTDYFANKYGVKLTDEKIFERLNEVLIARQQSKTDKNYAEFERLLMKKPSILNPNFKTEEPSVSEEKSPEFWYFSQSQSFTSGSSEIMAFNLPPENNIVASTEATALLNLSIANNDIEAFNLLLAHGHFINPNLLSILLNEVKNKHFFVYLFLIDLKHLVKKNNLTVDLLSWLKAAEKLLLAHPNKNEVLDIYIYFENYRPIVAKQLEKYEEELEQLKEKNPASEVINYLKDRMALYKNRLARMDYLINSLNQIDLYNWLDKTAEEILLNKNQEEVQSIDMALQKYRPIALAQLEKYKEELMQLKEKAHHSEDITYFENVKYFKDKICFYEKRLAKIERLEFIIAFLNKHFFIEADLSKGVTNAIENGGQEKKNKEKIDQAPTKGEHQNTRDKKSMKPQENPFVRTDSLGYLRIDLA